MAKPPPLPAGIPPLPAAGPAAPASVIDLGWAALFLLLALVPAALPQILAGLAAESAAACVAMIRGVPLLCWLVLHNQLSVRRARVRVGAVVILLAVIAPLILLHRDPNRTPLELLLPVALVLSALPMALRVATDPASLRGRAILAGLGVLAAVMVLPVLLRAGFSPARAYAALAGSLLLAQALLAWLHGGSMRRPGYRRDAD